ncbi:MAG: antibiotic biosynthesis monooxygenase [Chloroflexi bacterium]|nr:antibiotic biosynthesis monooxygenase [Chloroflexota bacterium]
MAEIPENEDGQTAEYITTMIRAHIKPGKEQEYEQWLHGINEDATQFAGFQGATILRPDDESHQHPEYVIVVRFAAYSDLRRWEHSPEFAEWQRRLEPLLAGDVAVDTLTGTETWFTLPGHTVVVPPPRYKMAVIATFGAAPFVLIVIPLMVQYLHGVLPSIGISIVILLVMSFAMTWVTMPLLARLARRWLYPTK